MCDKSAWSSFLETGKISDYLTYCENKKRALFASFSEGDKNAADDKRDCPQVPENE